MKRILAVLSFLSLYISPAFGETVSGMVYFDVNLDAVSVHHQVYERLDRPINELPIDLLGTDPVRRTWSLVYGGFQFEDVEPGTYLLEPIVEGYSTCTSHNRPVRLPNAVLEGHVKLVTFGDSIPVQGSDRPFPVLVAEYLSELADTELANIAIGGSRADQWVPGTHYFEDILAPELVDADVVAFTLGGNDFGYYFGEPPYDQGEIFQKLLGLPDLFDQIQEDLVEIADEIHLRFPNLDVVYIVYPNFVNTSTWEQYLGDLWPYACKVVYAVFSDMRAEMATLPYILLTDMLDALGPNELLDDLLVDTVHANDAGHLIYANEVFLTLGGVIIGDNPVGLDRMYGFDSGDLGQRQRVPTPKNQSRPLELHAE